MGVFGKVKLWIKKSKDSKPEDKKKEIEKALKSRERTPFPTKDNKTK